jgi:predicted Zn finger-like uncharacterized protein
MEPLDGNAIAGPLLEYFGDEMTLVRGTCRHCGTTARIAEQRVYGRAPGSVVRCRTCGNVVMVLVTIWDEPRVDWRHLELLDPPGQLTA